MHAWNPFLCNFSKKKVKPILFCALFSLVQNTIMQLIHRYNFSPFVRRNSTNANVVSLAIFYETSIYDVNIEII